jgi:LuxR family maltose regulon positive regulatory protein
VLNTGYAWALLESGALEAGESRLRDVEKLLETPSAEMIVDDEVEFQSVPASIANARTYLALAHGDMSATAQYARQALELLPENDHLRRGIPASLLGLACWVRGDLEAAQQSLAEALTSFEMSGNILFALTGVYVMADIQLAAGQLRKAINTYERYLQLAEAQGQPPIRGMADLHLGISDLFREQGDVQSAAQHLLKSEELSERAAFPRWEYRWCLVQARIRQSLGDLDGALAMLDDAEPLFIRGPVPDMRPVGALRAGVWIAQGKLAEAQKWVLEQGLSAGDELSYVREFEYLTLARLLIAQQQVHEAIALIARLLEAADSDGRTGNTIEILTIKALAHEAQGDVPTALDSLKHALTLAEPEGYVRVFVDEGPPMKRLLSEAAHQEIMPDYVGKLLATFDVDAGEVRSSAQPLIEPLSDRELEVLRLIADGLSNREIGKRLYLALDTVKGHNRRIYAKLGVQRRTEAVACARELGLL